MFDNATRIDRGESSRDRVVRTNNTGAQNLALAMAYMPMQCLKNAYSLEQALVAGTLFPELDKPFIGARGGYGCVRNEQ